MSFYGQHMRLHSGGYMMTFIPEHPRASDGYVFNHILKAEKILEKPLPKNAVIHHYTPEQLVICENNSYHLFLHRRTRAFRSCGNADWRKCRFCKEYDDPKNLIFEIDKKIFDGEYKKSKFYHPKCLKKYSLNFYQSKIKERRKEYAINSK